MSQLIGSSASSLNGYGFVQEDDDRLKPQFATFKHQSVIIRDGCKDPVGYSPYTGSWWPGAGMHGLLGDAGDVNIQSGIWHDLPEVTKGHNGSYFFSGYARNAAGVPTSGVTLKLFLTATDVLVSTTTSNPDGSYSLSTGFGGATHYIVAYLSGGGSVPDTEGTTVNTLVPGVPGA